MATSMKLSFQASLAASIVLAGVIQPSATAQTAPAAVPVPFNSAVAGLGSGATSTCPAKILGGDGTNYGDGCVGTLARLSSPQGAAVDQYGNVYIGDYSDRLIRVVYNGGTALAAAITAANSGFAYSSSHNANATVPVVGNIYTLAGLGETAVTAFTVTATDGKFACANYAGASQPEALDNLGDGCPAAASTIGPRDVAVDVDGNLFLTDYTDGRIRVLCVNCAPTTLAAQLIVLENPGVVPVNGAIYTVAGYANGYRDASIAFGGATTPMTSGLLRSPTTAALSSSDDVFIADNLNNAVRVLYNGGTAAKNILTAEGYTPIVGFLYTIAGAGCKSADNTHTGSTVSANSCLTLTDSDAAGLGTVPGATFTTSTGGVGLSVAWAVALDPNGNVYYTDAGGTRVKVIYAGIAPPLTLPNATYPTLQTGFTYSFAGQGTQAVSGVAPSLLALVSPQGVGADANGNVFFIDYSTGLFYETYAQNGLASIIGGGNGVTTPAANAYCNGGSTGPQMADAYYNGCPATQVKFASPRGPLVAAADGTLYFGDSVGFYLRKFSYNPTFPTTAVGASATAQPYAFTFLSAQTLAAPAFRVGSDFADAGNDTCTSGLAVTGGGPGTTCIVNVKFSPSTPGLRAGAVVLSGGSALMSGNATGSALAVDPGTSTTTGSTYTPNGIAVDGAGRVYFTDGTAKSVLSYVGGTTATLATGFTKPTGVAADAAGNVFVADATANTITEVPIAGKSYVVTSAVSNPHGMTSDGSGRIYIADTGNNRVLTIGPGGTVPTAVAFTGLTAPQAVAIDSTGSIYAADNAHVVKLTSAGVQSTVATTGGTGLAVDAAGNILVASGTKLFEYPTAGGSAVTLNSALLTPTGAAIDGTGNIYLSDSSINGFVELQRTVGFYKFLSYPSTIAIQLSSIGTSSVSSTAFTQTDTTDYTVTPATTNGCSGALLSGTTCGLSATFNPQVPGIVTDTMTFTAPVNNGNPTMTLTTVSLVPAISVQPAPATLTYGNTETLTATIYGPSNTSGTVIFYSGSTQLASVAATSSATAAYTYTPAVGVYSITATFTPTGASAPTVTSQPVTVTVNKATPSAKLAASPTSGYTTTSFALTATITPPASGTPSGTVTFYTGTTSLGTGTLANGVATLTTTSLPVGSDCLTAAYGGDSNFLTATSACTTVTVQAGFSVTPTSTALAFQKNYQEAQTYLVVNAGGRTDTISFACQGLPAKLSCAFTPATLSLSGVTTTQNIQMLVSNSGATAGIRSAPLAKTSSTRTVTLAILPLAALALFFGLRRRRLPMLLTLALLALGASSVLTGCGNGGPTAVDQASGSYTFTITVNSGTATLQTLNFTLTIP